MFLREFTLRYQTVLLAVLPLNGARPQSAAGDSAGMNASIV